MGKNYKRRYPKKDKKQMRDDDVHNQSEKYKSEMRYLIPDRLAKIRKLDHV